MDEIRISKAAATIAGVIVLALIISAYLASAPGWEEGGNKQDASVIAAYAGGPRPGDSAPELLGVASGQPAVQDVYIRALKDGTYDKEEIAVRSGEPVRLHFTADPDAGCGRQLVVYGLGVKLVSRNGEESVAEFTPSGGTYEYSCGMRMWGPGRMVVG